MRGDSLVLAKEVLLQDTTITSIWESWFASLPLEKQCSTKVSNELREDFTIKISILQRDAESKLSKRDILIKEVTVQRSFCYGKG